MEIKTLDSANSPASLQTYFDRNPSAQIFCIGNIEILSDEKIGFFCSTKSSSAAILKVFERANLWRKERTTIIGGFHSPLEREVLEILLIRNPAQRKRTNNNFSGAKPRNYAPAARLADSLHGKPPVDYFAVCGCAASFADDGGKT